MKTLSVVGARPQFIKAAVISQVLKNILSHVLVHTGQHYDNGMSRIFFKDLSVSDPDYDLGVGSGTHAVQTGLMLERLERVLVKESPDLVLVYGDTNSTLAGTLAAVKLNIPVGHVEAGLRSFNRNMPEEINRLLTDQVSDLCFCPTQTAVNNLVKEGITQGVYLTGDVMFDAALWFADDSEKRATALSDLNIEKKMYHLCTLHRAENTDSKDRLKTIIDALVESGEVIIFPVHPRTRKSLQKYGLMGKLTEVKNIIMSEPIGFLNMIQLEKHAKKIITDSGGVQKEAYFYQVPCITLREETEWIETVQESWNVLVGADKEKILQAIHTFSPHSKQQPLFGNGHGAEQIGDIVQDRFL